MYPRGDVYKCLMIRARGRKYANLHAVGFGGIYLRTRQFPVQSYCFTSTDFIFGYMEAICIQIYQFELYQYPVHANDDKTSPSARSCKVLKGMAKIS